MSDDPPRASTATTTRGFESGLRRRTARRSRPTRASGSRSRSRSTATQDVLWGLVRRTAQATKVTIEVDPKGKKAWRKLATLDTTATGVYALKATHRKGQRYRVQVDRARRQALHRPAVRVLLGSGPRRIWPFVDWGPDPVRRMGAPPIVRTPCGTLDAMQSPRSARSSTCTAVASGRSSTRSRSTAAASSRWSSSGCARVRRAADAARRRSSRRTAGRSCPFTRHAGRGLARAERRPPRAPRTRIARAATGASRSTRSLARSGAHS